MGAPSPARSRPRHGTVLCNVLANGTRARALSPAVLPLSAETDLLHAALVLRLVVRTRRAQRPDAWDGSSSVLCSDLRPAHVYFPPV